MKRYLAICLLLIATVSHAANTEKVACIYDPIGHNGDVYSAARDLQPWFLEAGIKMRLYPYSTESAAKSDFRNGLCDAVMLTSVSSREFNRFAATISAAGALRSYSELETVIDSLNTPDYQALLRQGPYEVAGIYPAGETFLLLRDRNHATPDAIQGKKLLVLHNSPVLKALASELNADAAQGDSHNFSLRFNRGKVDASFAPISAIQALEMDKAMQQHGGILNMPFFYLTMQLIIRHEAFPDGFANKVRLKSRDYYDQAKSISVKAANDIPRGLWLTPPPKDKIHWQDRLTRVRERMLKQGIYDKKMLKLLKAARCQETSSTQECNTRNAL